MLEIVFVNFQLIFLSNKLSKMLVPISTSQDSSQDKNLHLLIYSHIPFPFQPITPVTLVLNGHFQKRVSRAPHILELPLFHTGDSRNHEANIFSPSSLPLCHSSLRWIMLCMWYRLQYDGKRHCELLGRR